MGLDTLTDGVSAGGWTVAEEAAKKSLAGEKPDMPGEIMMRRAKALTYIINEPNYVDLKPLLVNLEKQIHLMVKGQQQLTEVQRLIDEAKQKGMPVEAIREILPPKVTAVDAPNSEK